MNRLSRSTEKPWHAPYKCYHMRVKLLNADWLRQRVFFFNHEGKEHDQLMLIEPYYCLRHWYVDCNLTERSSVTSLTTFRHRCGMLLPSSSATHIVLLHLAKKKKKKKRKQQQQQQKHAATCMVKLNEARKDLLDRLTPKRSVTFKNKGRFGSTLTRTII